MLSVAHAPIVDPRSGRTLAQVMGWYDWRRQEAAFVSDVALASHGRLRFDVVDRVEIDEFAPLVDGFRYDAQGYLGCWQRRSGFHTPEGVDYHALLADVRAVERVNSGEIDEVWLFGFPYAGYYESMMVGPGAFWCNAPPLPDGGARLTLPRCGRRFVVMGFSYEREVGCMLENLGHRAESIMSHVYRDHRGGNNVWDHFTRYELLTPGRASCGNVHFAPNSTHDYDWGNSLEILSDCDDWLAFPTLAGRRRSVTCADWGSGDMRAHHLWWFERMPHAEGETDEILNNWWSYIGDPNTVT